MKKILLSLIIAVLYIAAQSQITFERKFRPDDGYSVWSTIQTGDGGYVFTGRVQDSLFIGGLTEKGKIKWFKVMQGDTSAGRYMIRTTDNNFVVCGDYGKDQTWGFYIIKFDSIGTIKFQKHYRGIDDITGVSIVEANDGNYIVIGNTTTASTDDLKILKVAKTTGDSIWCKTYSNTNSMTFYEIKKVYDQNFIIVGERNTNFCYLKINQNGDTLSSLELPSRYKGFSFTPTKDSGIIVGSKSEIFKISKNNIVQWVKFDSDWGFGSSYWVNFNEVIPTKDGNYAVTGSWDPKFPWAFLIKFNSSGDTIFKKLFYDNISWTEALFVQQTKDSGFVISADQWDTSEANFSFLYLYVIKTDKNGEIYQVDTPSVCLITLDEKTEKNRIVWERQNSKGIEKYIVNRKEGLGWNPLGTKPYDSLSVFVDNTSSPQNFHYQYCIQAVNYNGDTVTRSPFFETVLLQASSGTNGTTANLSWNPYLDESGKFIPAYYYIYKGSTKATVKLLDSISGDTKNPSYNDTYFKGTTYYQVGFKKDKLCEPLNLKAEAGPYSQSLSNIVEYKKTKTSAIDEVNISAYPNPFVDVLTVEYYLDNSENVTIELVNNLGQKLAMYENSSAVAGLNTAQINAGNLASGVYSLKLIIGDKISIVKVSKQ